MSSATSEYCSMCSTNITVGATRGIRAFHETYPNLRHGPGLIVAAVDKPFRMTDHIVVLPYDLR